MDYPFAPYPLDATGRTETVSVQVEPGAAGPADADADAPRRYTLASTQAQREDGPRRRVVAERPGDPRVRSGSPLFDALFAMALDDAHLDSVEEIRDGAYDDGRPIPCACFQTGEKWPYVWTRDLSYAAHLGLAWFDPVRTATSLRFKTSGWRDDVTPPPGVPAGTLQIVQDTGSGGSWPVSTDRVTWAWGAEAVLDTLDGEARAAFSAHAYAALRGTLEADRLAAFDARSGLYGGEQSFLDWRTQTYAPWIVDNLSRMASAKALSTNVSHYQALRLAARLAREHGEPALAQRYGDWADALKAAIDRVFWLDDVKRYASLTTDDAVPIALHRFDLLGTALVVISGVAPPERAADALAHYPHARFGAPVIEPQQAGIPVYHNRALWPFVTAWALRAAAAVRNPAVAANAFESLRRAAALNLSNMENLEWLTAKPQFDDGPVINSRRQLWSVAAYLSLVTEQVFGVHVVAGGLRLDPFLTSAARRALGAGDTATLSGLRLHGGEVSVTLKLPPLAVPGPASASTAADEGWYPLRRVLLDGREVEGVIASGRLAAGAPHRIVLEFGPLQRGDARLTRAAEVDPLSHDDPRVFAPGVPTVRVLGHTGAPLRLRIDGPAPAAGAALRYVVHRDGVRAAEGVEGPDWVDPLPLLPGVRRCYAVEAVDARSGHRSHASEPACVDDGAVQRVAPGETFARAQAGAVGIELLYDNHAHGIDTGVTNAVKVLRVIDAEGHEAARGVVQMPHVDPRDGAHPLRTSTMVRAVLPAGRYRVELLDFFNMSSLESNARYGGPGGRSGPLNDARVQALRVVTLPAAPR
jgi:hypothetical protein